MRRSTLRARAGGLACTAWLCPPLALPPRGPKGPLGSPGLLPLSLRGHDTGRPWQACRDRPPPGPPRGSEPTTERVLWPAGASDAAGAATVWPERRRGPSCWQRMPRPRPRSVKADLLQLSQSRLVAPCPQRGRPQETPPAAAVGWRAATAFRYEGDGAVPTVLLSNSPPVISSIRWFPSVGPALLSQGRCILKT
jgi:hypothetical protein